MTSAESVGIEGKVGWWVLAVLVVVVVAARALRWGGAVPLSTLVPNVNSWHFTSRAHPL